MRQSSLLIDRLSQSVGRSVVVVEVEVVTHAFKIQVCYEIMSPAQMESAG